MEFTKRRAKDADAYEICASRHHQTKDISDTAPDNDTLRDASRITLQLGLNGVIPIGQSFVAL